MKYIGKYERSRKAVEIEMLSQPHWVPINDNENENENENYQEMIDNKH